MMPDEAGAIAPDLASLGQWLREKAWPLWLAHGVDRARGGFFEALDLRTRRCRADFRRLRVVARQIYVFSEAHRAGLPGAADAVELGLRFLERHAVHEDGGYAWRFNLDHAPIDKTRDLYDHAFVLLALSSAVHVLHKDKLRTLTLNLLKWMEREFAHAEAGYLESLPPALPRRQNPHMHFLEAVLAAYESFAEPAFLETAQILIDVFTSRLLDRETGALPEFFDEGLVPHRENGVFIAEPGHHCEWVWLLERYQALTRQDVALKEIASRLMQFVDRYSIDVTHGTIVDGVSSRGEQVWRGSRLWPQTERLKAEFLRPDATLKKQAQAVAAMATYLRPDGLWHERRTAGDQLSEEPAPASSLYHLTCAIVTVEAIAK